MPGFEIQDWAAAERLSAILGDLAAAKGREAVVPAALQAFSTHEGNWLAASVNGRSTNRVRASTTSPDSRGIALPRTSDEFVAALQPVEDTGLADRYGPAVADRNLPDRRAGQLSGGRRQRVAMGPALVSNPGVFLFDEPPGKRGAKLRIDLRTEIRKLHDKRKTTTVCVTHDQIEPMTLPTRIAVLYQGGVQQPGTPTEICDCPANVHVATVMGSPAMTMVPAQMDMLDGMPRARVVDASGAVRHLRLSQGNLAAWAGREVLPGIRPEAVTHTQGAACGSRSIVTLRNRNMGTEPAGVDPFVAVVPGGRDIVARLRAAVNAAAGEISCFAVNTMMALAFDPQTEMRILR